MLKTVLRALVCAFVAQGPLSAATVPHLVGDINPQFPEADNYRNDLVLPGGFLTLGNTTIYVHEEPSSGRELWVTDGTSAGTRLLFDFCPGAASSGIFPVGVANHLAFFAVDVSGYRECENISGLWRTDGTAAGTLPVRLDDDSGIGSDVKPSAPSAVFGNALFFQTCGWGCQLWKTDGTAAGTVEIADVFPGERGNKPQEVVVAGGHLFFFYGDNELWRTDGTPEGSELVKRFPTVYYGSGHSLTAAGSRVFFFADQENPELWTSDGSAAGTRLATSLTGSDRVRLTPLLALDGEVYFQVGGAGGTDLWKTDGTPQGTHAVTNFGPAAVVPWPYRHTLRKVDRRLFFVADSGAGGYRLWTSEGTQETTRALAAPESLPGDTALFQVGKQVLFVMRAPSGRATLWKSDGTSAGTASVSSICASCLYGSFKGLAILDRLFFYIDESLWSSDGTAAGTDLLIDDVKLMPWYSSDQEIVAVQVGRRIFFGAADDRGPQLWASDGTDAGTEMISLAGTGGASSSPSGLTPMADRVIFAACDGLTKIWSAGPEGLSTAGPALDSCGDRPVSTEVIGQRAFVLAPSYPSSQQSLWTTDGSHPLERIDSAPPDLIGLSHFQGKALVWLSVGNETSFWTSDGTAANTHHMLTIDGYWVRDLVSYDNEFFFAARVGPGDQIFRSDGTVAGTRQLSDPSSAPYITDSPEWVRLGGLVYFRASNSASYSLWKTDGTREGTVPALAPDAPGVVVENLSAAGGALFYTDRSGTNNWQTGLYRLGAGDTRGKFVATLRLEAESPQFFWAGPVALGTSIYFEAEDTDHGVELWRADLDGSHAEMIVDINPGRFSSRPSELVAVNGRLLFSAHDGRHGYELWESDGTAAGTHMVDDLAPGVASSAPADVTLAGNLVYFSADDGVYGRELWALDLDPALPPCAPAADHLCLQGGRYQVDAFWRDFQGGTGRGTAVSLTPDTGYFWFFDPANVEVVLKVLDGSGVNGHRWVFYGALSSVEYALTVTDTQTGAVRRYVNPPGTLASVGDTSAFGPNGATPSALSTFVSNDSSTPMSPQSRTSGPIDACVPSATRLCLNGGRFAVGIAWKDFQGNTGVGTAVTLSRDTGYFWFFDPANVEAVAKVLDGRSLNDKFWVFYGALSSVEYTLTVTDTETGVTKSYKNPSGRLASVADTNAF